MESVKGQKGDEGVKGDRFIFIRSENYAVWVKGTIPEGEWSLIRQSLQRGQLTGSSRFVDEIEKKIARRVEFRGRGRPSKTNK